MRGNGSSRNGELFGRRIAGACGGVNSGQVGTSGPRKWNSGSIVFVRMWTVILGRKGRRRTKDETCPLEKRQDTASSCLVECLIASRCFSCLTRA
jgi:hypothetical protein